MKKFKFQLMMLLGLLFSVVLTAAFWLTVIYVSYHFIVKYW